MGEQLDKILFSRVVFIAVVFWSLSKKPAVKENYGSYIKTDGVIEAKYLQKGKHEISYMEKTALHFFKKYEIYYPGDIVDIGSLLLVMPRRPFWIWQRLINKLWT